MRKHQIVVPIFHVNSILVTIAQVGSIQAPTLLTYSPAAKPTLGTKIRLPARHRFVRSELQPQPWGHKPKIYFIFAPFGFFFPHTTKNHITNCLRRHSLMFLPGKSSVAFPPALRGRPSSPLEVSFRLAITISLIEDSFAGCAPTLLPFLRLFLHVLVQVREKSCEGMVKGGGIPPPWVLWLQVEYLTCLELGVCRGMLFHHLDGCL